MYSDTSISWQYSVWSESASYDRLRFYVYRDGKNIGEYGNYGGHYGGGSANDWPNANAWANFNLNLTPGTYSIYFRYSKDGSVDHWPDRAAVRSIRIANSIDDLNDSGIGSDEPANTPRVLKTQEEGAGEGEIYNPVFYERIPLDYLRQAAQHAYDNPADVSANLGARIDEEYLERVLNAKDATTGEALGVAWYDRYGNDVTALRTRGLKLKATLVGTETEASDYGGSMNYTSRELGLCTNGGLSNPCLDGGSNKYTWGKAFNDLDQLN